MGALQFGHDSSPWMTREGRRCPGQGGRLQFGHDSSPWMTAGRVRAVARRRFASIRPRLIAVDDGAEEVDGQAPAGRVASIRPRLIAVDDAGVGSGMGHQGYVLQFGHDSSPWMTVSHTGCQLPRSQLQFGHDSSPWMTGWPAADRPPPIALQFGHDSSPWMTPWSTCSG